METDEIAKFLGRCVEAKCASVELVRDGQTVMTWNAPFEDVSATSAEIYSQARSDATDARGATSVSFAAVGMHPSAVTGSKAWGRHAFAMIPPREAENFSQGQLMAELVRDRRETLKMVFAELRAASAATHEQLIVQTAQARKAEAQHIEMLALFEELMSNKEERTIRIAELKSKHEIQREAMGGILPLVPTVMGKLLAKAVGAPVGSPPPLADEAMTALLKTVTAEELERLGELFGLERGLAFYEIYKQYRDRAEAQETAAKAKETARDANGASS